MSILLDIPSIDWLGLQWFNEEDFTKLAIRFLLNFFSIFLIIKVLYYNKTRRKDYLFTFFLVGTVVYFLCFLLDNVKLELGLALGLFAIFAILRYRTNQIPIREMTYLFIVIGIGAINALANSKISIAEILFTNAAIIILTFVLERLWLLKTETRRTIDYEKIELIKPEKRNELIKDLEDRTGLNINRIEIGRLNFLRDTARIRIYFFESEQVINTEDMDMLDDPTDD